MLTITIKPFRVFDEATERFMGIKKPVTLQLEHSLISVSKWEAKWHKPFLSDKPMTPEQLNYYIQCMTLTTNVEPVTYYGLTDDNIREIKSYIDDPMTATFFSDEKEKGGRRKPITNEVIYGWMVGLQIPFHTEKWHLNRLLTLIKVVNNANQPKKKKSTKVWDDYAKRNEARRKAMNSKG